MGAYRITPFTFIDSVVGEQHKVENCDIYLFNPYFITI